MKPMEELGGRIRYSRSTTLDRLQKVDLFPEKVEMARTVLGNLRMGAQFPTRLTVVPREDDG